MVTPPMKAAAPKSPVSPRCPATAISAIPTRGTVRFARMLGRARRRISLFRLFKSQTASEHIIPGRNLYRLCLGGLECLRAEVFPFDDDAEKIFVEPLVGEGEISVVA